MDIWTILTIVSIPPTLTYYGVKWHRARQAKRRAEIVRRVQSIPLERAVYRMRENVRRGPVCEKCGGTHVRLRNGGDCMGPPKPSARPPHGMMG